MLVQQEPGLAQVSSAVVGWFSEVVVVVVGFVAVVVGQVVLQLSEQRSEGMRPGSAGL